VWQVYRESGVYHQRHLLAVPRDTRPFAKRAILRLPPCTKLHALAIRRLDILWRPHVNVACRAIDNNSVSRLDQAGCIFDFADGWNSQRPRDNRNVRCRSTFLENQPA
jgi:hypothetical protein